MKIAIVTTTVREGRVGLDVANWILENALKRKDGQTYELVDLKDYKLPIMGLGTESDNEVIASWVNKMNSFDAYIFATAEYNRAPSGVFKNAMDYLKPGLNEKVVSFVGYGGLGGVRAIEQMKLSMLTSNAVPTGISVNLLLNNDFKNMIEFSPQHYQEKALNDLFEQTLRWASAFNKIR